MDLLGVGPMELIFIIVLALIVIGPRELGSVARSFGRFLNRLYKSQNWRMLVDTSRTLRNLPQQLAREAALEELDLAREAAKEELNQALQLIDEVSHEVSEDVKTLDEDIRASTSPPPPVTPSVNKTHSPEDDPLDTETNEKPSATP